MQHAQKCLNHKIVIRTKNVWIKIFQPSLKTNVFSVNVLQLKKIIAVISALT